MNYKKIHDSIITRARTRVLTGYKERHHIVPTCMGGSNRKTNIVELTGKEHYLVHLLLTYISPEEIKLVHAFWMMTHTREGLKTCGRVYEDLRHRVSLEMRKNVGTKEAIEKMSETKKRNLKFYNPWNGKKHSKESKNKMSLSAKSREISPEMEELRRLKISRSSKKPKSREHKENISNSKKGVNNPMFGKKWKLVDGKRIYY